MMQAKATRGERVFDVLHFFCGIGGTGLGFSRGADTFRGVAGSTRCIGAIDVDPQACEDYERIVGTPATCMDLFSRRQYEMCHGEPPPEGWREVTAEDLLEVTGGRRPDIVCGSPPCTGFSGLVGNKRARTDKYRAFNELTLRWVELVMEAWADAPPSLFLLENVRGIQGKRGSALLSQVKRLLSARGYTITGSVHNCGEFGGGPQIRHRFLLIARHESACPALLYKPRRLKPSPISSVLEEFPLPNDPAAGAMHVLPKITKKTKTRLAMIRPGKDWKDLERWQPGAFGLEPLRAPGSKAFNNVLRLVAWGDPSPAVTSGGTPTAGGLSVADPRITEGKSPHGGVLGVLKMGEPSTTITGRAAPTTGKFSVADPRLTPSANRHATKYRVNDIAEPAPTVTGTMDVQSGAQSVADPRLTCKPNGATLRVCPVDKPSPTITGQRDVWTTSSVQVADPRLKEDANRHANKYRVSPTDKPSPTVTGARVGSGAVSVADPRLKTAAHGGVLGVQPMDQPARTVTGESLPTNGTNAVADPRLNHTARNGLMGVAEWMEPMVTVTGADVQSGTAAVQDPRIEDVIIVPDHLVDELIILSEDGEWHRPITPLEMALLQGLPGFIPERQPDGSVDMVPLTLAGGSATRWRKAIGNMVPVYTACAIAEQMIRTLLVAEDNAFVLSADGGIWVDGQLVAEVDMSEPDAVVRVLEGIDFDGLRGRAPGVDASLCH